MSAFPPVAEQLAVLERGVADFHVRSELEERLESSRRTGIPIRVKAGFDPTRPDLHLGHTVLLEKMRQFQDLGHTAIFLVGDFTAMVGDPTGQNDSRPRLSRDEVRTASETYVTQAYKVLERSRVELRYNSEWLDKLSAVDVVELMAKYTVSRMLERKDFRQRFEENRAIHQHEFLYPLLQGYDSVALQCDVELGGTDQLFNLLVGRDLMAKYGLRPQVVMTTPILEGTDARVQDGVIVGKKMSKSAGNTVGIQDSPIEMFRKIMLIDDDVIFRFFDLLSRRSNAEIDTLRRERRQGRNPREIKALFAREVVERFHLPADADRAALEFDRIYSDHAIPDDIRRVELTPTGPLAELAWALKQAGLAESTSDAWRKVQNGGVEVDGARATDPKMPLEPGKEYLVRVGSKDRKFARICVVQ